MPWGTSSSWKSGWQDRSWNNRDSEGQWKEAYPGGYEGNEQWGKFEARRSSSEMPASPQVKSHTTQLPREFVSDQDHLDSREICGKKLYRNVQLTSWSQKYKLAGRPLEDIKLHELAWQGWQNYYLRHLSLGYFTSIVFCRRISETVFINSLLGAIRGKSWDLDALARAVASHASSPTSTSAPPLPVLPASKSSGSTEAKSTQELHALVTFLIQQLEPFASAAVTESDKDKRIKDLEQQVAAQSASKPQLTSDPSMGPPSKRRRLATKTSSMEMFEDKILDFKICSNNRPLAMNAPSTMSSTNVRKWWMHLSLNPSQKDTLKTIQAQAQQYLNKLSAEQKSTLQDRACQLGLPVSMATKAKALELVQVICAGILLADG